MRTDRQLVTEADILLEVLTAGEPTMKPELAEWLLTLHFTQQQQARMLDLADRNNAGTLAPGEREEMVAYVKLGDILSILHSKARLALRGLVRSA
jgi:hypothetical protein